LSDYRGTQADGQSGVGGGTYHPSMALNNDLGCVTTGRGNYGLESDHAWGSGDCPWCGPTTFLVVARQVDTHPNALAFLRCVTCRRGVVINNSVASPPAPPLPTVEGCPADVERAWGEATSALSVGATTAAVMMCRKLLFHIAVEQGLPATDDKGRAPTFAACLQQLRDVGIVTPPLAKWVEHIRDIGNEANHDLAAIEPESASRVATSLVVSATSYASNAFLTAAYVAGSLMSMVIWLSLDGKVGHLQKYRAGSLHLPNEACTTAGEVDTRTMVA